MEERKGRSWKTSKEKRSKEKVSRRIKRVQMIGRERKANEYPWRTKKKEKLRMFPGKQKN